MEGGRTVLLVEDNPNDLKVIEQAFEKAGFAPFLRAVQDAEEATAYISGVGPFSDRSRYPIPALVLLDMYLPGRSGLQFIEWFRQREQYRAIPVIALTGVVDYDLVKRSFAAGANSYIVKPQKPPELVSAVETVLRYWLVLSMRPE